jgi:hypothetical protein
MSAINLSKLMTSNFENEEIGNNGNELDSLPISNGIYDAQHNALGI